MRAFLALSVALVTVLLLGCTAAPPQAITVYSGRNEALVGPLIERFRTQTNITVEVRYADSAELAALILEEGAATPADVFFSQDAGALGAIGAANQLRALPQETLARVPEEFRADAGNWVGISGRARVVAYDTREISADEMPTSISAFTDPAWRGRIGWAPTNSSFQSFVTAMRVLQGEDAAGAWLEGVQANEPRTYPGNSDVVRAIASGEIDVGFVNHYYLLNFLEEEGEDYPVRNHFLSASDPGSLINAAGAGILASTDAEASARRFIDFLLSNESQQYFATETHEYPLVAGLQGPEGMPALGDIQSPDLDLSQLADLQATQTLLTETGVLQ